MHFDQTYISFTFQLLIQSKLRCKDQDPLYIRYFLSIGNKPNMTKWDIHLILTHDYIINIFWECSGSEVDYSTRYQNVAGSSPTSSIVLFFDQDKLIPD